MTSAIFSDFLIPSPLVTVTNQLIVFLSSAFWGPPLPADVIYRRPLRTMRRTRRLSERQRKEVFDENKKEEKKGLYPAAVGNQCDLLADYFFH